MGVQEGGGGQPRKPGSYTFAGYGYGSVKGKSLGKRLEEGGQRGIFALGPRLKGHPKKKISSIQSKKFKSYTYKYEEIHRKLAWGGGGGVHEPRALNTILPLAPICLCTALSSSAVHSTAFKGEYFKKYLNVSD